MIKGVIFDLDGVLVSTDCYHYQAWKAIADKEGIYFDEEINNRLRGVSRMDSLDIILEKASKKYSKEEKEELANEKNAIYRSMLKQLKPSSLDKDVKYTIKKLYKQFFKMAVASSSKNADYIIERLNIGNAFDSIINGTMISKSKPDPEIFLKAAEALNLKPSECLVIEDAEAGINAAKNGGFIAVGIGSASGYNKNDYSISKLSEIFDVIDKVNKETSHKIDIEGLGKVYPNGNVRAVNDFNLTIDDNEFVVFVGPSGCGKSTVLRMIAGLEEITEGKIYLDGKLLNYLDPKDRDIAMVFQNYALYPHLSVRNNIAFPLKNDPIPFNKIFNFKYRKERKDNIKKIVEDTAKKINLYEYLDRKPANLSGGQRQRVALGRAVVRNPKVFLLDEPLSNLDAKMRVQMRTEITKLHNELKTVFIYVTHDQVEAMTMGTKIVVLKDGIIQQVATPDDLFLNPVNMFVAGFIGTPQMNFIDAKISKKNSKYYVNLFENSKALELPSKRVKKLDEKYIGSSVVLGIRPKALFVEGDLGFSEQKLKASVNIVEQLGEDTILYCNVKGYDKELIISTTGLSRFKSGQEISFSLDLNNVCLFDKETTLSIL